MKKFTLIEMLVVITVIALLLTLLLPSLGQARKKAEQAVCASNMKQVTIAMNLFLKDNSLFFPLGIRNNSPYDDLLAKYDGRHLTDSELSTLGFENTAINRNKHAIYNCPSSVAQDTSTNVQRTYVLNNGQGSWFSPNSYGLTWLRWNWESNYDTPVNINHINTSSQMYLFTELDVISNNSNPGSVGHTHSSQGRYIHITDSNYHDWLNLHGTLTMNAVFVDGSLKVQRQGQLSQDKHWDRDQ